MCFQAKRRNFDLIRLLRYERNKMRFKKTNKSKVMYIYFLIWTTITIVYYKFDEQGSLKERKSFKMIILSLSYFITDILLLINTPLTNQMNFWVKGIMLISIFFLIPVLYINLVENIIKFRLKREE